MNADPKEIKAIFWEAVEKHDAERWPAFLDRACPGQPELRRRVEVLLEAHRVAGTAPHEVNAAGPVPFVSGPGEQPGSVIGPYRLLRPIGEGGMGTVWLAEQTEPVQRHVALKVIKAGMDSQQVIARFEAERQVLALMEHPNIARVLDAGTTDSGRLYFVMELVRGVPLTRYCDEFRLTLRQRLELFVPVCRAVLHAHQKGVIHRDLKPSNVLVTLYDGRPVPKVIDFGVAKATGPRLAEGTLCTGLGTVVGTLEYMSPEQAELTNHDIDTRSDIYSLGVMLYELLTGTTPLDRARLKQVAFPEMLRMIREEEPPRPSTRLSASQDTLPGIATRRQTEPAKLTKLVRGELDWIVMKALEKDRNRRYETANHLAADVLHYLADEPVQACPPSAWYRFRKFARRHKGGLVLASVVMVAMLLIVAAVAGSIGWLTSERAAQRAALEQEVLRPLDAAEAWCRQGKWSRAQAEVHRARALLAGGEHNAALRARALWLEAALKIAARLEEIPLRKAALKDDAFDSAGGIAAYEAAFRDGGIPVLKLDPEEAVRRVAASPIRRALVAALDSWSTFPDERDAGDWPRPELLVVAQGADTDPWRRQCRDAMLRRDRAALLRLAKQPRALDQAPEILSFLGQILATHDEKAAEALLRQAQQRHPADFWINHGLAYHLMYVTKPSRPGQAVAFYRAAAALRPESPGLYLNLCNALSHNGETDEAIAASQKAIALKPDYAGAHHALGLGLFEKGQVDEAIAAYQKALALMPDSWKTQYLLGEALLAKGRHDEAIVLLKKAVRVRPDLWVHHAKLGTALGLAGRHDEALPHLLKARQLKGTDATTHFNLAVLLQKTGRPDEAIAAYLEAVRLAPKDARSRYGLGFMLREHGRLDEAIAAFREVLRLKPDHADAQYSLGLALAAKGRTGEAEAAYRKTLDLKPDYGEAHGVLGLLLWDRGEADKAIACYREALKHNPGLVGTRFNLGRALARKGQLDEAIAAFQEGLRRQPDDAKARYELANALKARGLGEQAIAAYREAIRLKPDYRAHNNLGRALRGKGDLDGAIAEYRKAIALEPKDAFAHANLGSALAAKDELDDAIAEYRKAIALDPELPEAHLHLGDALRAKGALDEAIAVYRAAVRLQPDKAEVRLTLGNALRAKGLLDEAIAAYRAAVRVRPDYAAGHNNLGLALFDKGQRDDAIAAYRQALKLNPNLREAHLNLGNALAAKGLLDDAMTAFREAIRVAPAAAAAHLGLGAALHDKGRLDEAIPAYRRAIALEPRNAAAHLTLGNALNEKKQSDEAIDAFRSALRLRPGYAEAHYGIGNALRDKGRVDDAIAAFQEALRLQPGLAVAHVNLGNLLLDRGEEDRAIAHYQEAIRHRPLLKLAYANLSLAFVQKGRIDDAIAILRKAITLQPDDMKAHWSLGVLLCERKRDYDGAIAAFREAVRLAPKAAVLHCNLGNALRGKGRWQDAAAAYEQALRLQPDDDHACHCLAWLRATAADPAVRDAAAAVKLARKAVALRKTNRQYWNTLGIACYRAGDWKASLEALTKGTELTAGAAGGGGWFFAAMAHAKLGNPKEARQWYDRAVQWMARGQPNDADLRRFRAEAAEALGITGAK